MPNTVSNYGYYTAISPTIWSEAVQQNLYKQLVALKVCSTKLEASLPYGKAIQIPKFASLTAATYTPGTDLSAQSQIWTYDTINVSTYQACTFYIDSVEKLQSNISTAVELAGEAGYQLKNNIDAACFNKITGGASVGLSAVNRNSVFVDASTGQVTAASTNIVDLFAGMTKVMRANNVEELGDWCAVITPSLARLIEIKAAGIGFNTADATIKNGFAGTWMGWQVYISNNLPSGAISAMTPSTLGGPSAAASTVTGHAMYFGRKGCIDLIMQRAPALEIRPCENKIGSNFITWTVYGAGITTRNRGRAFNVSVVSQ
jgi:hypothetical protein